MISLSYTGPSDLFLRLPSSSHNGFDIQVGGWSGTKSQVRKNNKSRIVELLRLFQIRDYNNWNSVLVEKRHKFEVYNDFRWNAVLRVIVRFSNLRSLFDAF